MRRLPEIPTWEKNIINTNTFMGLNRGLSIGDGEMADMRNMSADNYPVLSTREMRGTPYFHNAPEAPTEFDGDVDGMLGSNHVVYCQGGKVYLDGVEVPIELSTEAGMKEKKLVGMGAYVCIWPDKKYFNVTNLEDSGDMGSRWQAEEGQAITAMMCRNDGTNYDEDEITVSAAEPSNPSHEDYWLNTAGANHVLLQYSSVYKQWIQVATTFIKLQATGIGKGLKEADAVHISGARIGTEVDTSIEQGTATAKYDGSFKLNWSAYLRWDEGNQGYIRSDNKRGTKTITLNLTGIPDNAVIKSARLSWSGTEAYTYGYGDLYVNGKTFTSDGSSFSGSMAVDITSNGSYNFKFEYESGTAVHWVTGSHDSGYFTNYATISNIKLTVLYDLTEQVSGGEWDMQQIESLNTTNLIYGCGDDYIIVAGLLNENRELSTDLVVEMKIPDLDYVCEANNRIWGCTYSEKDGTITNELRCCSLGDFRNWYRFEGTSQDSYVATVGSDGNFTGAYALQGYPLFFKEDFMHKVTGYMPSNFTLNTVRCRGVQDGSWRSMATVNEALFYKGRNDVMTYDGSLPYAVSAKLGTEIFTDAVGGGYRDKYYLCMKDEKGMPHVYVLDTAKGLWHKEDNADITHMATSDGELVMAIRQGSKTLLKTPRHRQDEKETYDWSATFGTIGYTDEQQKYLSRYNIRAQMTEGSRMKVEMQYDSSGKWEELGTYRSPRLQTFLLPIIPKRCDHCQLRISGDGQINIYAIAREYERGGDG